MHLNVQENNNNNNLLYPQLILLVRNQSAITHLLKVLISFQSNCVGEQWEPWLHSPLLCCWRAAMHYGPVEYVQYAHSAYWEILVNIHMNVSGCLQTKTQTFKTTMKKNIVQLSAVRWVHAEQLILEKSFSFPRHTPSADTPRTSSQ